MTTAERANEWVKFAQDDLRSAEILLKEGIFNEVCFHAQQCAEKIIKSFMALRGRLIPKTHRLIDLLEDVLEVDSRLEKIRQECIVLDQYYIPTRYPDAVIGSKPTGLPSLQDAEEALQMAKAVFSEVQAIKDRK